MPMEQFQQPPVHQNSVGLIKSDTKRVAVVPTHISSAIPVKAAAEGVFRRGQTEGWEHLMHTISLYNLVIVQFEGCFKLKLNVNLDQ